MKRRCLRYRLGLAALAVTLPTLTACGARVDGPSPYDIALRQVSQRADTGQAPASGTGTSTEVSAGAGQVGGAVAGSGTGTVAGGTTTGGAGANTVPAAAGGAPSQAPGGSAGGSSSQPAASGSQAATSSKPAQATPGGAGAVTPAPGAPATGGAPVVIGAVGTRSGVIGENVAGMWAGLEAWAGWVNANGGLAGHRVDVVAGDDGGDPGRHVALVRRIISDRKPSAFINFAAITFSAGVGVLEQAGIPAVGGEAGDAGWFTSPIAFPLSGERLANGKVFGTWAPKAFPDKQRLAIFYINEVEVARANGDAVAEKWRAAGKQVVVSAGVSFGQPDFSPEILRAKAAGAELVALFIDYTGCRRFLDAGARQDYKPIWLQGGPCYHPSVAEGAKQAGVDVYVAHSVNPQSADTPEIRTMLGAIARFRPDLPNPVVSWGPSRGWADGRLVQRAVEVAGGKTDPASIIAALHSMKNETVYGMVAPSNWPPGPHPESSCGKLVVFHETAWKLATPDWVC